ncbi:ABC transporter permease [Anaerosporobacter faecicola]|uniref:ABC transporter permease n=1 Tax=Anaerosporobacter faecicola TaxID=2718714 RepID=UPI00143B2703|nr:ABC transporter permease [Anaerosporobacter faecicola]
MKRTKMNLKKGCITAVVLYVLLITIFYFVAGEQLYFRESDYEIKSVAGDIATPEVTTDFTVKETFLCRMNRINGITLQLATLARMNTGNVIISVNDETVGKVLWETVVDVSTLTDSVVTEWKFDQAYEDVFKHTLAIVIRTEDGQAGNAIAPWYLTTENKEDMQLYFNNEPVDGTLCFSVFGDDAVWTGPHYWLIMGAVGILLVLYCMLLLYKEKNNKKSLGLYIIHVLKKYRFLIKQLVSRDFKIKYKRSVLGMFWSFFNPLLTMIVQYFVFSTIFKAEIAYYPVYLLAGIVLYGFFSEATGNCVGAIVGNASLIKKVYMPKYIYPVSKVFSSAVNLVITLLPLLIVAIITKVPITKAVVIVPFVLICLVVFSIGIGFILSAGMVFFRDIQFIWSVVSMVWMYGTPIFYPESILPKEIQPFLQYNPLYCYIQFFRTLIIDGISPEPMMYVKCVAFSLLSLIIGVVIFRKGQDKFILYL